MAPSGMTSTGRGGAGNMAQKAESPAPDDLSTPQLKAQVFTTGRGGAGNMMPNTDPQTARDVQDVGPPAERSSSQTRTHVGRGGAANTARTDSRDREAGASNATEPGHEAHAADTHKGGLKGLVEKGKDLVSGHHNQ